MLIDPTVAQQILTPSTWSIGQALEAISDAASSRGCVFMAIDAGGRMLTVYDAFPAPIPRTDQLALPVGYGVMGRVVANGVPALLPLDSPRDPAHRELLGLAPGDVIARMCLPVPGLGGRTIGVLSLHRSPDEPYTHVEAEAAAGMSALLGLRWDAERLRAGADRADLQQDTLVAQAISAQEAERRRIAGDLHDGVTQVLVSMNYHLSAASAFLDDPQSVDRTVHEIAAARELSLRAYDETRTAISGLHSLILDDLGLVAALESLAQTTSAGGLAVDFVLHPGSQVDTLPDHVASALYRIAQEALHNSVKHATATNVQLFLSRGNGRTTLVVTDDGIGFDTERIRARSLSSGDAEHYGLSSIAERCALLGAKLRIESAEGDGTTVVVELGS